MAYPGDMDDHAFPRRALPLLQRARRSAVEPRRVPMNASVAVTAIAVVFASFLAGCFLTLVLFSPKENRTATTAPVDVLAGMGR
jgi:hypothetical protein